MTEFSHKIAKRFNDISDNEQKYQTENSRRPKNKEAIRKLENEIDHIYGEIVHEFGPSISYLYLKAQGFSTSDRLRGIWQKNSKDGNQEKMEVELFKALGLAEQTIPLEDLPKYSFTIRIEFKLSKPYISRNDEDFYVIDNPVLRDKVFRVPMVRPSGWKGSLFGALYQMEHTSNQNFVKRVFGEVKESGEEERKEMGFAGRMRIFPSFFFDLKTGVEIINPRERQSQAGTKPIPFEAVKQGSHSVFSLLYTPLDRIAKDEDETRPQVQQDIATLLEGITGMFTTYGFGAKTSSGFGTAQDACTVEIKIKGVKTPILASSFTELASEQKIKEVTDSIQEAGK